MFDKSFDKYFKEELFCHMCSANVQYSHFGSYTKPLQVHNGTIFCVLVNKLTSSDQTIMFKIESRISRERYNHA